MIWVWSKNGRSELKLVLRLAKVVNHEPLEYYYAIKTSINNARLNSSKHEARLTKYATLGHANDELGLNVNETRLNAAHVRTTNRTLINTLSSSGKPSFPRLRLVIDACRGLRANESIPTLIVCTKTINARQSLINELINETRLTIAINRARITKEIVNRYAN